MHFHDRKEAGRELAKPLSAFIGKDKTIVLALPRGGVPVAVEVARILRLPLDLLLVRKLGVPGHEELAMGAIAIGDVFVANKNIINKFHIPKNIVEWVVSEEKRELARRNKIYRDDRPFPAISHQTVILVDDGVATGANMRAAIQAVRKKHPAKIVVAVPVSSNSAYAELDEIADEVISLHVSSNFSSVGAFYDDFGQLQDAAVSELLGQATQNYNDSKDIGESACESA